MGKKGHEGDFWGADNVLCFDPGNGYTSVFTCKNSLSYTSIIYLFFLYLIQFISYHLKDYMKVY